MICGAAKLVVHRVADAKVLGAKGVVDAKVLGAKGKAEHRPEGLFMPACKRRNYNCHV